MKKIFFLIMALLVIHSYSQVYVNKEWVNTTPVVGSDINRTASITNQGILYVTGNLIVGGNTDVLTIAYTPNGDTLWYKTQSGTLGGDDYGTSIVADPYGNIIVAAATENSGSSNDFSIYHYNGLTGSLNWSYTWNGVGNGIDIPAKVQTDPLGAVYVTGGSQSSVGTSDFVTLKISASGSLIWDSYYDYASLHDAATDLVINGYVVVTGASNAGIGDWDIAALRIHPSTGTIVQSYRSDIPEATIAEATAIATDNDNNVIITGFTQVGADKNIQTIKLDPSLNLVWVKEYESPFDDVSNDIATDEFGNVYITGYSDQVSGKPKVITIKYAGSGDALWTKLYGNTVTEDGAIGRKIEISENGEVYVAGSALQTDKNSFLLFDYNSLGELQFSKRHEVDSLENDGFELAIDSNSVYVTGFTNSSGDLNLTTVKYSSRKKNTDKFYDSVTGQSTHIKRELIVKVSPSLVKTSEVDQLEKTYWDLSDIFEESFATEIDSLIGRYCSGQDCSINVYRIFNNLQSFDTLSLSRLGSSVEIPEFWSTFLFEFAESINIDDAASELSTLFPSVNYVTYNLIGKLHDVPTDPFYNIEQLSLHPDHTGFWADNHINVEPAWNYTTGRRDIKVGILDSPVEWTHEDFGGESGTKVNGWDYILNESIYTADPIVSAVHGTSVAGIVGAIRNNDLGIAGIAGGSYASSDDIDSSGVEIFGVRVLDSGGDVILNHIANGVVNSAMDIPDSEKGFGLDIMNNSWGISNAPVYGLPNPFFLDTNIVLLREAFHFANRNDVTVVASRGNSGILQDGGTYHYNYPAILDDDWILCVGGTGTDGNYHDNNHVMEGGFKASRGWEIDIAAASAVSHNFTTQVGSGGPYNVFSGTSAAAPHASGTAALLMSYLNDVDDSYDNLAPEDIEYLLETTAFDRDLPGRDSLTGYGVVNAGGALAQVDKDDYILKHFGTDAFPFVPSQTVHSTNDTITLSERYQNSDDIWFLPDVPYVVNTFKINTISEHSIIDGQEIIASWERPSSSNVFALFDGDNVLQPRERIKLDVVTETQAFMTGYIYQVSDTLGNFIGWIPFSTDDPFNPIDMTYSLLIKDTVAFAGTEELKNVNTLQIYPNPTNGIQTLNIEIAQPIDATIRLIDINGKVIYNLFQGKLNEGQNQFELNTSDLSSGVYFYTVVLDDGETIRRKMIKN